MENKQSKFRIPASAWPVEWGKKHGMYFYLEEIEELRGAKVKVRNYGEMIMLSSYSYLGLLGHPEINRAAQRATEVYGTGTHGVRLLAGTIPLHHELEQVLAAFKGTESAIVFSSGYVANVSTLSALLRRNDLVICDKLNHASIVDGCLLSGSKWVRYRHNDMKHLEECLRKAPQRQNKLVVIDAVFSMDGDIANLPAISELCRKYGALLMVDEAHSIGVLGKTGNGIEEHFNLQGHHIDLKMGTLSKTIPSMGGYIAGSDKLIQFLKHNARGFIFSAALAPPLVAASIEAIKLIEDEPDRIRKLTFNSDYFRNKLRERGFNLLQSQTPITPIICGDDMKAWEMAKYCWERGLLVHGIPSPVVPNNLARLRAIVTAAHSIEDLDYCIETITAGGKKLGVI